MPSHLKRCSKCKLYSISEKTCKECGAPLERCNPPRFSLQDKYQDYRIPYFKEKMKKKFGI